MKLLESPLYRADLNKAIKHIDIRNLDGKTVFITGGLGLIGSTIADILLAYGQGIQIYIGTRNQEQFRERYGEIGNISFYPYDALKPLKLDFIPNYIIHAAGLASPELYISKPVETILSNFEGIHTLLQFSKNNPVERVLYVSSSEVYGRKNTTKPFVEGTYGEVDIDNIRSSYVIAKRASEMMCKAYTSEYGVNTVIVRPGHIFGPSAKPTDKRVSSEFAYRAASGKKIQLKSAGQQERSYCYSVDCAIQILTVLIKGKCGEAYNIGHDEITTIRKMAEEYAKSGECELALIDPTDVEKKVFNPMDNAALNNEKVKKLGYRDIFSVEEGLTHTVKILKEIHES